MAPVTGSRKCRIRGCQRKTLFVGPADNDPAAATATATTIAGEATHCADHWPAGFRPPPQETVLPQDGGSSLQDGQQVTHSADHRGSGTGGGNTLLGRQQAAAVGNVGETAAGGRAGKGKGKGKGKGNGGSSVSARPRRASGSLACRIPGCGKRATHGPPAEATRCAAHKEKGQIDHKHRLCENTTPKPCLKQPSFGWPGESRKRFCSAHRPAGTVDLRNCEQAGCGTRASHGFGKGRARFCALHSPPGTSLVANRPCEKEGCTVSPRFGDVGGKPRFCASHKETGMVNLKDRRCEQHPCTIQPTFALPGEKPRFCSKHKAEDHVNVRHKLCRHPQCKLVPTYGMRGTRVPVACLEHSEGEMVDLKRERMRMAQARKKAPAEAAAAAGARTMEALVEQGAAELAGTTVAGRKR